MDEFCDSKFWDRELTWNTTDPYFTHCFEETVVTWIPTGFLLLFALVDIFMSINWKRTDIIPWNIYTGLKCCFSIALLVASIGHLANITIYYKSEISTAEILSPCLKIACYVVSLILVFVSKRHGIRSSGVQFFFWFSTCLCEAILFRTAVRKYDDDGDISSNKLNFIYLIRFITFPLITIQFLLHCWADGSWNFTNANSKEPITRFPCPEKNSSLFSKLLVLWYDGMALKGYRQPLAHSDLWDLNEVDRAKAQVPMFYKHWNAAQQKARAQSLKTGKVVEASIASALVRSYGAEFVFGGSFGLIYFLLPFVSPEILKLLVAHVASDSTEESWKGFLYAGILLIASITQTFFVAEYTKRFMLLGMRIRTSLQSAVYRKALKISSVAKKEATAGEIVNLMSSDTQILMDLMTYLHNLWISPIVIVVATYFLYNTLGFSVFAGLAVMVLLVPANGYIAEKVRVIQMERMKLKDQRVKLMNELLSGIKILKLYAWEHSFQEQIDKIRDKEKELLKRVAYFDSCTLALFYCTPFLVSLATFATYVLSDETNILNAEKSFASLALFNIIKMPLTMFPMTITKTILASVSAQRLNKYMNLEEIDPEAVTHDVNEKDPIVVENGTFSWSEESKTLVDINLNIKEGSLVAVVGMVGSGKSSLLNALLGDLIKHSGKVNTKGSISYVAQGAWIQNATLKDNILFNDICRNTQYKRVIEACALGPDLKILPDGDETEIGEKGINLSGGQKQRVALARAAYKESDIYLWDDPLSAVDAHVGKHIFDKLIGQNGMLKGKTRVLVTHGISYLSQVDSIIVMKEGRISEAGSFKDLLLKKGEFSEFLVQHLENGDNSEIDESLIEEMGEVFEHKSLLRKSSLAKRYSNESFELNVMKNQDEKPKPKNKLIEAENIETGNVKLQIYTDYVKAAGIFMSVSALFSNIAFQGLSTYSNIWLSDWATQSTKDEETNGKQDSGTTDLYLGVYGGLGVVQGVTMLIATFTLALGAINSAQGIHWQMLTRVTKAPMSYFDTTPKGRLINRFTKDVDTVDTIVPWFVRAVLNNLMGLLSAIFVISYSTPMFLTFVVPCAIVYFFIQRFYIATSRQLKRIESVSRSPVYSHFGETLAGVTTIRAFGLQDDFIAESERKIDSNQQCFYPTIASNMWIIVRLENLGNLIIFASAMFAVLARGDISPAIVGLSVSYALQVTTFLNYLVRVSTELETHIIAVERMKELTDTRTPQEADWVIDSNRPNKEWPQSGAVEFNNYQARYREGLDLVLRGITCSIGPGEKVGVVGRTGAGKSSLTLALFRIIESAGGNIKIDGHDISEIGLHDLRSKITIIPQDPVLFSGNLRINLDPFNAYTDDQVWNCLELAHLKTFIKSLPEGLLYEVAEEGQNFSVGQRQLVCLARALLRKTKILVLDEATAAVDLETDDLIQKTIRSEFLTSTVITIAHRLNTIMDSNRVIVLDKGKIREFDTPQNLLQDTSSIFYGLAKDAGLV